MGTQDPLVRIEAATLAGGDYNQDRYAYGDGWAFVLDGASSFSGVPPVHDGGWYADRLKAALVEGLTGDHLLPTTDIVAQAIYQASAAHDESVQGPCPTSTVALARWTGGLIDLFVLGDSFAGLVAEGRGEIWSDKRLERVGERIRTACRREVAEGRAFGPRHHQLLGELQSLQLAARNRLGGYWIAGNDPSAAYHARTTSRRIQVRSVVKLFTDGCVVATTPSQVLFDNPPALTFLKSQYLAEQQDPEAKAYPRSKLHDDKTLLVASFDASHPDDDLGSS